MNKMMIFFLSLCLLAAMVNCGSSNASLVFQDTDREITVKQGEIFKIELASNIGTGYSWTLKSPIDSTLLTFVDQEYIENDLMTSEEESKEIWRFQAIATGKTSIHMIYKKPWEEVSEESKELTFQVEISN